MSLEAYKVVFKLGELLYHLACSHVPNLNCVFLSVKSTKVGYELRGAQVLSKSGLFKWLLEGKMITVTFLLMLQE